MSAKNKSSRILEMYSSLLEGNILDKQALSDAYNVDARSIQRDIDTIRDFLSEQMVQTGIAQSLIYDTKEKGYKLVSENDTHLSGGDTLALCKILLESRAFSKEGISTLLDKIIYQSSPRDKKKLDKYIGSEVLSYISPAHPNVNTDFLWQIENAVTNQNVVEITYNRLKDKKPVMRKIWPVGILFSEYYFYLMGYIADKNKRKDFEKVDDPYPTIYRIDRISSITVLKEHFYIPERDKFREGEYKNRAHFMFGGEVQTIEFKYYGPSIEAVLDRFPMAQMVEENGAYKIRAEVFGKGVLMWLLSQGSNIQVLSPDSLRSDWLSEIHKILTREEV